MIDFAAGLYGLWISLEVHVLRGAAFGILNASRWSYRRMIKFCDRIVRYKPWRLAVRWNDNVLSERMLDK